MRHTRTFHRPKAVWFRATILYQTKHMLVITHSDVAVRLDFVNPEALLHQGASSAEEFLKLPQSERPHLNKILQSTYQKTALHN